MRVLVACEFSGRVRDAFRKLGHDAWSLDVFPSETTTDFHLQIRLTPGDERSERLLRDGWDLMICHPPCTHLATSGARWFPLKKAEQKAALAFVRWLLECPIPRIALENPKSIISTAIRKPDQTIQPHFFGHPETKTTCLWLKNLPLLVPTNHVPTKQTLDRKGRMSSPIHRMGPGITRGRNRSRTFQGIADAMAEQWGGCCGGGLVKFD